MKVAIISSAIQSLVSLFNNELLINKYKGYGIDKKELKLNYNLTDLLTSSQP